MEDFSEILNANKTAGRKRLESITLEVLNIKEEAPETYKIKLILPLSINGELSSIVNLAFKEQRLETLEPGVVFPPGTEVAFQPHVNQGKLNHLLKLLKTNSKGELKWLQPVKGYPGPELCYPSLDLLKLLLKKTLNTQDKRIKNKAALLQAIVNSKEELKEFQATYDVADILENFSQVITAKELWLSQPAASQHRLYTIIPEKEDSIKLGRPCFSISVKLSNAFSPQRLLAENPVKVKTHEGPTSSWLCSLKKGDKIHASKNFMGSFAYKKPDYLERPIVFISQGNATEGIISLLYARSKYSKTLIGKFSNTTMTRPPCYLLAGFKTKKAILGKSELRKFLKNKTLTAAHIALSDETLNSVDIDSEFKYHSNKLVTDVLPALKITYPRQAIYLIEGNKTFCECVKHEILKLKGNTADIRITSSRDRVKEPSVMDHTNIKLPKPLNLNDIKMRMSQYNVSKSGKSNEP